MSTFLRFLKVLLVIALTVTAFTGCESTGGGGGSASVYYGVGFYDPWYYGDYDQDIDITLPDRPDRPNRPVHPEQPIARPPGASTRPATAAPRPSARPTTSIPSTPRPAARAGGGRR
jgi:hypothetical protein